MADIPLAADDKGNVLGFDGQTWRPPDDVAVNDSGQKAYRFGNSWQIAPVHETNEALNTLRYAGTAAIQGVGDVANIPSTVMSMAGPISEAQQGLTDWFRRQFGAKDRPKEFVENLVNRERNVGNAMSRVMDVKRYAEMAGIPTDPEAQAKEHGWEVTPFRKALGSGVRTAAGSLAMGAGPMSSALSGLGAGIGQDIGGDTGAMIGSFALPLAYNSARGFIERPKGTPGLSEAQLESMADDAFANFKNADVAVTKDSFKKFADSIEAKLLKEPILDKELQPKTLAIFNAIKGKIDNPNIDGLTLGDIWGIRRTINKFAGAANPDDARLLGQMKRGIDSYLGGLTKSDALPLFSGDIEGAVRELRTGMQSYAKLKASQEIQEIIDRAKSRAGGYVTGRDLDKALRVEFRKLNNPEDLARFQPQVADAIKRVAEGTTGRNVLSFLGRFSPQGVVPGIAHGANIAHNPILGIPLAAMTYTASKAAGAKALNQANMAAAMARGATEAPGIDWLKYLSFLGPVAGARLAQ